MPTAKVGIAPMKVAQISKPGGDFEIVEREIPNPGAGEVRIKVQACHVSRMPAWTVPLLPQPQSYRHHLRRRISAIHGRSGPSARGDTGHT